MTVSIVYDVDEKPIGVNIYQGNQWIMIPKHYIPSLITGLSTAFKRAQNVGVVHHINGDRYDNRPENLRIERLRPANE